MTLASGSRAEDPVARARRAPRPGERDRARNRHRRPRAPAHRHRQEHPVRARHRRGPGRGAREGHRSPRPQAREPLRLERRPDQDPRLRAGQADVRRGIGRDERPDEEPADRARHGWEALEGLAWSPKADEIWFTGARSGTALALHDQTLSLYPVDGGAPRPIPGTLPGDGILRWTADGSSLFVLAKGHLPARIFKLDLLTGRREPWKELAPEERAGALQISGVCLTPDGTSYAYGCSRGLSDLFVVDGLK